jgi:5-methylcytosine-specific restriction endonuclease McrA
VTPRQASQAAGLTTYFTGRPCPNGHIAPRFVSGRNCTACTAAATDRWVKNNPEKKRALRAAYHERDLTRANRLKRESYARNKDRYAPGQKAYQEANPHVFRAARKRYALRNPDKVVLNRHNMRAQRKSVAGRLTKKGLEVCLAEQAGRCAGCFKSLEAGHHIDHVVPLARGGTNTDNNIQFLCAPCNTNKGAKHPLVWFDELWKKTVLGQIGGPGG